MEKKRTNFDLKNAARIAPYRVVKHLAKRRLPSRILAISGQEGWANSIFEPLTPSAACPPPINRLGQLAYRDQRSWRCLFSYAVRAAHTSGFHAAALASLLLQAYRPPCCCGPSLLAAALLPSPPPSISPLACACSACAGLRPGDGSSDGSAYMSTNSPHRASSPSRPARPAS
jgi:hypothetical protein